MFRKILARLRGVLRNRGAQRGQPIELRFVPQLPQEAHAQPPAVEVAAALEQMDFEQRLRYRVHRGSITDARHAGAQVLDLYDVYPAERRTLAQMDVGGWKAEILAELRAVHHMAAQRVGTAEEPLGIRKVAHRQRTAHGRA